MIVPEDISSIVPGETIRALFIGENGVGKSTAIGSFPEPILYLDFDGRMLPVRQAYPKKQIKFVSITYRNFGDVREYIESLQLKNPFATIGLDGITGFTNLAIVYQMILRGSDAKKTKAGIAIPGFDEYNGETMLVTSTIELLRSLKANLIVTAHPLTKMVAEGPGDKLVRSRVIVSYGTKVASMVPGYFDEIYNFMIQPAISAKDSPKRIVHTTHLGTDMAKTALRLPAEIDITNRYDFYNIIKASMKGEPL